MADYQSAKGEGRARIGRRPATLNLLKLTEGERYRKPSGLKRAAARRGKCKQAHFKKYSRP